jgi:hypothetical protein
LSALPNYSFFSGSKTGLYLIDKQVISGSEGTAEEAEEACSILVASKIFSSAKNHGCDRCSHMNRQNNIPNSATDIFLADHIFWMWFENLLSIP